MIVWRPWEQILARSSKTVGEREKCLGLICLALRATLFGAIAAVQRLTTRPVEARVCMYPGDPPID